MRATAAFTDPASFYNNEVFGGAERVARLGSFLAKARAAGARTAILSNGLEAEIHAALSSTGLKQHFDHVFGSESQDRAGTHDKPSFIALQCAAAGVPPLTHIVFADDDRDNYPEGPGEVRAATSTWLLEADSTLAAALLPPEARASLPPVPAVRLVAWPAGEHEGFEGGLSPADLDGIAALLN